jgi:transposase
MLQSELFVPLSDFERQLFAQIVPHDHFLRQLERIIDFERFRPTLAMHYCLNSGRPPLDPVMMLKLDLLSIHYRYSDRELMRQAQVNMAMRLFLNLGCDTILPHPTSMTYFRQRVGPDVIHDIFHGVLGQAREMGLVRDRLRLKDATHVIANIAIPSTIRLVAEIRDQLLDAAEPFDKAQVAYEWQCVDDICMAASEDRPDTERLVHRVEHLRRVLSWADELPNSEAFKTGDALRQEKLLAALTLAHKILADRDDPKAGDKVISVHDTDARCGKHGEFFDGYLLDISMDADSELLTGVNLMPANGNEGADAAHLIEQEETAHGNDVEGISIDGAGYRGSVLRELTKPLGLNLEVFTPPTERIPLTVFGPDEFTLSEDGKTLSCPAGKTTTSYERNEDDTGKKFRFSRKDCKGCCQREQCLAKPEKTPNRTVTKNDYEKEYKAAQAKAQTPEYEKVRKEHPAVERKLSEMVRWHDMRQARYRGLQKVRRQALLTGITVNMKRIVKLRTAEADAAKTETVRAEVVMSK